MNKQNKSLLWTVAGIIILLILYKGGYLNNLGLFSTFPAGVTIPSVNHQTYGVDSVLGTTTNMVAYGEGVSTLFSDGDSRAAIFSYKGVNTIMKIDNSNLFKSPNTFKNGYFVGDVKWSIQALGCSDGRIYKNANSFTGLHQLTTGEFYGPGGTLFSSFACAQTSSTIITESRILASPGQRLDWCPSMVIDWYALSVNYDRYIGIYDVYGWKSGCGFNYPVVKCYEDLDCASYGTGYTCDKTLTWDKWECTPPLVLSCTEEGKIIQYKGTSYTCFNGYYKNTNDLLNLYKQGKPPAIFPLSQIGTIWSSFLTWLNNLF